MNIAAQPLLWLNTIRYLQPGQILRRPIAKVRRKIQTAPMAPRCWLRGDYRDRRTYFPRQPTRISNGNFTIAGLSCALLSEAFWRDRTKSQLWLYNVHYLDYLTELPDELAVRVVDDWIDRNGDSRQLGWDPYPVSRRLVSLLRWMTQRRSEPRPRWLCSIYAQARHLAGNLEYHLMGNHLLENARALICAGLTFEGPEPARWLATGRAIMREQLREQVLPDGGHFERSPMYHSIVLEGLLDLINFGARLDAGFVEELKGSARVMLRHLERLLHPDGQIALLNDSAHEIAPGPAELFGYGRRLGLRWGGGEPYGWARDSGLAFVRDKFRGHYVAADLGPIGPDYQPGHAHADTLSFELSLFGRRIVVDSGISDYAASAARRRARSTGAHNTVAVDETDQSEMWSAFRVGRRAYPFKQFFHGACGTVRFSASHDGYLRLPAPCVHRRDFRWRRGALSVADRIIGVGEHQAQSLLHLHPDVRSELRSPTEIRLSASDGAELATVRAQGALGWQRSEAAYSPMLGIEVPNEVWSLKVTGSLPIQLGYELSWRER